MTKPKMTNIAVDHEQHGAKAKYPENKAICLVFSRC